MLKSQINPHFLFNTLNNIDVLILENPVKASDYLKKLSEILRFALYDTTTERIPLSMEIDFIRKYIELQKLRTVNDSFVDFKIAGEMKERFIAPMILIHFVENAFKYVTNKKIKNAITIHLTIIEDKITFLCKNHINLDQISEYEKNGLGVQLIKQRLDLLYKTAYKLNVNNEDNWYIVTLDIDI